MSKRRPEIVPLLLGLVALSALGVSALAMLGISARPSGPVARDQPARSNAPADWPLAQLEPLDEVSIPLSGYASLPPADGVSLRVPPPSAVLSSTAFGPSETDLLAIAPLPLKRMRELVVLVPAKPQWRAGQTGRIVISKAARQAWAIGPIDTLRLANRVGQALGGISRPGATAALASRLVEATRHFAADAEAARLAQAGPALGHATRVYRVTPVAPPRVRSLAAPPQTIVEYLGERSSLGAFPVPETLAVQLDRVVRNNDLAPWAWDVAFRLRCLARSRLGDSEVPGLLAALEVNASEAFAVADLQRDEAAGTELRRAAYGILRRTAAWSHERAETLALLERRSPAAERLEKARWAMASGRLGPMLVDRASRHDVLRVARRLERYESDPSQRLARSLAEAAEQLSASQNPSATRLGAAIEQNYRNANVRFAIASDLVERLLPQTEPITSPVRDRIAGTPVTGRSTTVTRLGVKLTPDDNQWRIELQARGSVASQTYSRGGPAVLGSKGKTSFIAQKQILLSHVGISSTPSVAEAQVESQRLVSLKTDYDRIPLLKRYVRSSVRDEYRRVSGRAAAETRVKIEQRVTSELDQRVTPRLGEIEERFASEVTDRLAKLGLRADPVELRTTETRLIGRVRVANRSQLAAHTPRMRAPGDSLLSVQLHESMLNNALMGLGLAGETLTPTELRERLTDKLQLPPGDSAPGERALLRFAAESPIRFRLADGQAEMTLSFDELRVRGRSHRNFKVHAFYRPEVKGLEASLVRVGTPHIEGRMRTSARIHLHGVMGKVLGEGERIPLIRSPEQGPGPLSGALVGLATNQFVIEDGWLGLAIGPPRGPSRVATQVGGYVR